MLTYTFESQACNFERGPLRGKGTPCSRGRSLGVQKIAQQVLRLSCMRAWCIFLQGRTRTSLRRFTTSCSLLQRCPERIFRAGQRLGLQSSLFLCLDGQGEFLLDISAGHFMLDILSSIQCRRRDWCCMTDQATH